MIRAAAAALLLAVSGAASAAGPVMTAETCRIGWQAFADLTKQPPHLRGVAPHVTETGWCRVDWTNAALTAEDFEAMDWRAEGLLAAVENGGFPLSLEMDARGIDPAAAFGMPLPAAHRGAFGTLTLSARRTPATRAFSIRDLTAGFGALGGFTVSASGGGIDLSTLPMMQFTLGGLRLREATLDLETTDVLSRALIVPLLRDMGGADVGTLIAALPATSIDGPGRAALAEFAAALPDAAGRLEIAARAEQGLGVMQLVAGVTALEPGSGSPPQTALDILFNGVNLTARWTPDGG